MIMSPFKSATYDNGGSEVNTNAIDANTEMLSAKIGIRGGKALIVHSTGKVGLGTADGAEPLAKLHVVGDVKATDGVFSGRADIGVSAYHATQYFQNYGNSLLYQGFADDVTIGADDRADWQGYADALTNYLRTNQVLHVMGSTGNDCARFDLNGGQFVINGGGLNPDDATQQFLTVKDDGFGKSSILASGKVGIGTTSPVCKLHVAGAIHLEGEDIGADLGGRADTPSDAANRTNTLIAFGTAGSGDDWAYLRQIGAPNEYTLALDFHDDGEDAGFEIRDVKSTENPDTITSRFKVQRGGNVGIGTTSPTYKLDVNGSFRAHTVEINRLCTPAYTILDSYFAAPAVWALAGDTTAFRGGGAITPTSPVSVKNLNGIPYWFFGNNDCNVDIANVMTTGNTWTIAIAIAKKPESKGIIFCQIPPNEGSYGANHNIVWNGKILGDEYQPGGGSWNTGSYVSIPDESTLIIRRNGTGSNSLTVFLNGGQVHQTTVTEGYSGATPSKIRLGQRTRMSGYFKETPLYMGIAAVAAWNSAITDYEIRTYVNYQSLTTKG
tara:strand:+ start:4823 stop:6481 length:1659 start_codon:yes stop_codon:yes gene_type:complete